MVSKKIASLSLALIIPVLLTADSSARTPSNYLIPTAPVIGTVASLASFAAFLKEGLSLATAGRYSLGFGFIAGMVSILPLTYADYLMTESRN